MQPTRVSSRTWPPSGEEAQGQGAKRCSDDSHGPQIQNQNRLENFERLDEVTLVKTSEHSLRAWKVLVGALCLSIPTYGLTSAIGLFQTHWQENQLSSEPADKISWILSIYGFLSCFLDIAAGALFDHVNLKYYLPFGCLAYGLSFLGLGWASTYAQFLGCFMVAGVFTCWSPILPQHFSIPLKILLPPSHPGRRRFWCCRSVVQSQPLIRDRIRDFRGPDRRHILLGRPAGPLRQVHVEDSNGPAVLHNHRIS